jgi:hypothetical protein
MRFLDQRDLFSERIRKAREVHIIVNDSLNRNSCYTGVGEQDIERRLILMPLRYLP